MLQLIKYGYYILFFWGFRILILLVGMVHSILCDDKEDADVKKAMVNATLKDEIQRPMFHHGGGAMQV